MKKSLNEGPGAGYTITGTITDVNVHHFTKVREYDDNYGRYEEYKTDIMAIFENCEAYSYYEGGEVGDVPIKITSVALNVPIGISITNEDIEDALNGTKIEVVYGGGWSHSTFDGHIATDYKGIENSNDLDYIIFDFVNKEDIEYLDKVSTGDDWEKYFAVYDEDDEFIDDFDDEDEAIEYAKKNKLVRVELQRAKIEKSGEVYDVETVDTVWERPYSKSYNYDESLKEDMNKVDYELSFDKEDEHHTYFLNYDNGNIAIRSDVLKFDPNKYVSISFDDVPEEGTKLYKIMRKLKNGKWVECEYIDNYEKNESLKEAYGWADDYWHDIATKDEMKKTFSEWIMESDGRLQSAYEWYKNQDKDALGYLVSTYLDETYTPMEYYKTFEENGQFGIRDKNTNELLFKSDDSRKVDDWIDMNDTWSDETFDMWYDAAKKAVNEIGYYQFNDEEEIDESMKKEMKEDKKMKKYSDIIREIDDKMYILQHHNKNLTKEQEYAIDDLQNLIHELRLASEKNESMKKKLIKEDWDDIFEDETDKEQTLIEIGRAILDDYRYGLTGNGHSWSLEIEDNRNVEDTDLEEIADTILDDYTNGTTLNGYSWYLDIDSYYDESLKEAKDKKNLKESYYDEAYDIIQDLVERAEENYDGDEGEAIMQAIDEGLIYTSDIWALGQYYHSIDDGQLIESYFEDLFDEISRKANFATDEEEDEEEIEVDDEFEVEED